MARGNLRLTAQLSPWSLRPWMLRATGSRGILSKCPWGLPSLEGDGRREAERGGERQEREEQRGQGAPGERRVARAYQQPRGHGSAWLSLQSSGDMSPARKSPAGLLFWPLPLACASSQASEDQACTTAGTQAPAVTTPDPLPTAPQGKCPTGPSKNQPPVRCSRQALHPPGSQGPSGNHQSDLG